MKGIHLKGMEFVSKFADSLQSFIMFGNLLSRTSGTYSTSQRLFFSLQYIHSLEKATKDFKEAEKKMIELSKFAGEHKKAFSQTIVEHTNNYLKDIKKSEK